MRVAIFGLGYVGCVTGACLAEMGNEIIGVDANEMKVSMINNNISPIVENGVQEILKNISKDKLFLATTNWNEAIEKTDVALVCVGTPSHSNGSIDMKYITRVSKQIGQAIRSKNTYYSIGIRSTVLPGTVEDIVIPAIENNSEMKTGKDFGICMIPEFLREGSSVNDFYNPPKSVIGEYDKLSGDPFEELFKGINAPLIRTKIKVAEMVKYADNSFHALKITFANEIGNICKEMGIDSHSVMNIFCMDDKLNLSPYYLKPGFAFGGSCLPKDLRAITYRSRMLDVETPVLNSILASNKYQVIKIVNILMQYRGRSLGFMGMSFKAGTDDLRESPNVELIEAMLGKGFNVTIFDENVSLARLIGANKEYIEKEIPHISSLMCSTMEQLINNSDVIIVGNYNEDYKKALFAYVKENHVVIDLVRIAGDNEKLNCQYYGICW